MNDNITPNDPRVNKPQTHYRNTALILCISIGFTIPVVWGLFKKFELLSRAWELPTAILIPLGYFALSAYCSFIYPRFFMLYPCLLAIIYGFLVFPWIHVGLVLAVPAFIGSYLGKKLKLRQIE